MKTILFQLVCLAMICRSHDDEAPHLDNDLDDGASNGTSAGGAPADRDMVGTIDNANPGVLRIPYGEYPHPREGLVQVFSRKHAQDMQRILSGGVWDWARSVLRHGWHALSGKPAPVVIGHPDNTDAPQYGKVTSIEALDNEAHFHVDWKAEGKALVSGDKPRFSKFSPRWKFQERGGKAHPFALVHMGLTNTPVIPVPSIDNARDEGDQATGVDESNSAELDNSDAVLGGAELDNDCCMVPMDTVRTLRGKLFLPEDATFEQVLAALDTMEANHREATLKIETLRAEVTAEAGKVSTASNERDELKVTMQGLKKALTERGLKEAQKDGKVKPVEFNGEVERIAVLDNAEAIEAALEEVSKRKPVLHTRSDMGVDVAKSARSSMTLDNETKRNAEALEAQALKVQARAAELVKTQGMTPDKAYARAFAEITNTPLI